MYFEVYKKKKKINFILIEKFSRKYEKKKINIKNRTLNTRKDEYLREEKAQAIVATPDSVNGAPSIVISTFHLILIFVAGPD